MHLQAAAVRTDVLEFGAATGADPGRRIKGEGTAGTLVALQHAAEHQDHQHDGGIVQDHPQVRNLLQEPEDPIQPFGREHLIQEHEHHLREQQPEGAENRPHDDRVRAVPVLKPQTKHKGGREERQRRGARQRGTASAHRLTRDVGLSETA